jgi:Ser/Thr protein kinase RdoA (MazF antagonist)
MIDLFVELQSRWVGRTDALLALGVNDWRAKALAGAIETTFERNADDLGAPDRDALSRFLGALGERFEAVAACGLPDTLVHGDFSPGNLRSDGERLTLIDWGDSGVGHPMLDQSAFLGRVPAEDVPALKDHWHEAWRRVAPGSDPARASALLAPVGLLRQAVVYQGFLDGIEPSEHPYHRADPADRLSRAADLIRYEARGRSSA